MSRCLSDPLQSAPAFFTGIHLRLAVPDEIFLCKARVFYIFRPVEIASRVLEDVRNRTVFVLSEAHRPLADLFEDDVCNSNVALKAKSESCEIWKDA